MHPCIRWIINVPRELLEKMIAQYCYASRNQIRYGSRSATKHHILTRGLNVVVNDRKWSWAIPSANCLSIVPSTMNLRDVRVSDFGFCTVQRYSALDVLSWKTMNIATVNPQVVWNSRKCSLG